MFAINRTSTKLLKSTPGLIRRYKHGIKQENFVSSENYCIDLVKKGDYEHYLTSLFMPAHLRAAYIGLRAFNLETSMIKDQVSNDKIGKMRFLFWKDAIDNTYKGNPPHQPITIQLHQTIQKHPLSSTFFKKILNERSNQFDSQYYNTLEDLDSYGENTASSLLYLQLELMNIKEIKIDHIVSHLGKAIAITNLLRSLPYHISKRDMVIPSQLLANHQLSQEELYRSLEAKQYPEKVKDCVFEVATRANDHIITARSMMDQIQDKSIMQKSFPAILTAVPTIYFLKRLEKADFDLFQPNINNREWKLPFYLFMQSRKGHINI